MSSEVSLGYLTPVESVAEIEYIGIKIGQLDLDLSSREQPAWDYESPVQADLVVSIDHEQLLRESGFDSNSSPELVIHPVWFSTKTKQRGSGPRQVAQDGHNNLRLFVEGTLLGGELQIWAAITLLRSPEWGAQPLAAKTPGTRLWTSDPVKIQLEGNGSRFTTVPVDFKQSGRKPEGAMWRVELGNDLHVPVEAGLRVYVNVSNKVSKRVLNTPGTEEAKYWKFFLQTDVLNQMVLHTCAHIEESDQTEFDQGSLGESLMNIVNQLFPKESLLDIATDPARISSVVHAHVLKETDL